MKDHREKEGRKELVFGYSPKATHTQGWMLFLLWGQCIGISQKHFLFFAYFFFGIRSSPRPIQRSDMISSNCSSCFKVSPHLYSKLEPLCAYVFDPGVIVWELNDSFAECRPRTDAQVFLGFGFSNHPPHFRLKKKKYWLFDFFALKSGCNNKLVGGCVHKWTKIEMVRLYLLLRELCMEYVFYSSTVLK